MEMEMGMRIGMEYYLSICLRRRGTSQYFTRSSNSDPVTVTRACKGFFVTLT